MAVICRRVAENVELVLETVVAVSLVRSGTMHRRGSLSRPECHPVEKAEQL